MKNKIMNVCGMVLVIAIFAVLFVWSYMGYKAHKDVVDAKKDILVKDILEEEILTEDIIYENDAKVGD